jgi:O-acetyl-ADP-ribose deacetylase
VNVQCVEGDLLDQPVDAIVNAWNRNAIPWWLLLPQGVSGAIKRRGGYTPFRELGYRWLPLGCARHTSGGKLPYKGIIHVAGINLVWRASEQSIRDSVHSAIGVAVEWGYASIAFPVIGAGSGGFDETRAEQVMRSALAELDADIRVVLVRFRPT